MTGLIASFDPGLASLGSARVNRMGSTYRCHHAGTYRTGSSLSDDERFALLWERIVENSAGCTVIAVESQHNAWAAKQATGETNASAVKVREVVGMLRARAYQIGARLVMVTPREIRKALGLPSGAKKDQVRAMIERMVTGLPKVMSEHACDALAIGVCGERMARMLERGAA
jgi:crossover junction endodeoxyribonuclease RuvC